MWPRAAQVWTRPKFRERDKHPEHLRLRRASIGRRRLVLENLMITEVLHPSAEMAKRHEQGGTVGIQVL